MFISNTKKEGNLLKTFILMKLLTDMLLHKEQSISF